MQGFSTVDGIMYSMAEVQSYATQYRYYVCNGNAHKGKSFCPGTSWSADKLEEMVTGKMKPAAQSKDEERPQADEDASVSETKKAVERIGRL